MVYYLVTKNLVTDFMFLVTNFFVTKINFFYSVIWDPPHQNNHHPVPGSGLPDAVQCTSRLTLSQHLRRDSIHPSPGHEVHGVRYQG